ncbi:Cytochrome P450 monooxygenase ppzG [Cladobotryum mycophilum]|uniref:Cytochrome P450 monooxygenase ppzG n=1 Tax=Cladobotryum mycophilum TaxID=491253 RepID=A0ABR0SKQ5_9HYPO
MLHNNIELHKKYGPVIRTAPNQLDFCNPAAYHDIYSSGFNGIKDPESYEHLGGEEPTFFTMSESAEFRARYRPVASLFGKRHYDRCEPSIRESRDKKVELFCRLLSVQARAQQPCNLGTGYRSLTLKIAMDFIFSSVPDHLKCLASENFDDPLTVATGLAMNWTVWLARGFPNVNKLAFALPHCLVGLFTRAFEGSIQVGEILEAALEHEKDPNTPKNVDSMIQRLLNAHLDSKSDSTQPHSDNVLLSEVEVTMWGGMIDLSNIFPFGTFMVSRDLMLQQRLYEELKSLWSDLNTPVPSYTVLRELPLLNGVVKESMRLTHGVVTGPPRLVCEGSQIDGHLIPAKAVVAAPSYFVHMDAETFADPEKFDPERWFGNDYSESLVVFSKGRRMCPASHLSYIEMFLTFASVFRRYRVTPYETTIDHFNWNQYFSIQFNQRPLRVMLEERID